MAHRNTSGPLTSEAVSTSWKKQTFLLQPYQKSHVSQNFSTNSWLSVLCFNRLPQPGSLHVSPPEPTVHCSAQLDKSKEKVTTNTVKTFVPHMVAAHTLLVSVPKREVYLLLWCYLAHACLTTPQATRLTQEQFVSKKFHIPCNLLIWRKIIHCVKPFRSVHSKWNVWCGLTLTIHHYWLMLFWTFVEACNWPSRPPGQGA